MFTFISPRDGPPLKKDALEKIMFEDIDIVLWLESKIKKK
jgi:hypothetical protein